MLLHSDAMRRSYAEFLAVYWELRYFAPDLLPLYFPSLGPLDEIDPILRDEFDPHSLLERLSNSSEGNRLASSGVRLNLAPPAGQLKREGSGFAT